MAASTIILTVVAIVYVRRLETYVTGSQQDTFLPYQQAQKLNDALDDTEISLLAAMVPSSRRLDSARREIDDNRLKIHSGLLVYARDLNPATQPQMLARLDRYGVPASEIRREQNSLQNLKSEIPRLDGLVDSVWALISSGEFVAARGIYEERAAPSFDRAQSAASDLMSIQLEQSVVASGAGRIDMAATERSLSIAVLVALVLAFATILWLTRHITRPLKTLVKSANAVARGDLSQAVAVTANDEIGVLGVAFNEMISALREERDRAQRYLDTAGVILLALDREGRITLVNRYACSVLGRTADELLGHDWIDTCLPEGARETAAADFGKLMSGDVSVVENPILTKGGDERLIEWHNTLLRDDDARIIGTFSSGTDVTERSVAAETLRKAEERMRFALESADIGIWDSNSASGVVEWSPILEAQYGLEPGTFGGTMDEFAGQIFVDDRAGVLDIIGKAMLSGDDFSCQNRSVWPDGSVHWLAGAGRFQLGEDGKPTRGVGISMDVTDRRRQEVQSQQSQKMEAIGRLASGVAHDFNNLLTVILGFADLLAADGARAKSEQDDLGEIVKAAKRATLLTKQLLAFGRQQVLHIVPIDINRLITEMAGMLVRLIGEDIQVSTLFESNICNALGDKSQLEQVVMNLVVNARDAMAGGGQLTIRTSTVQLDRSSLAEETATKGVYVMLSIGDTGTGMTNETRQRLFEPFYTTKEEGKGTGLGLATTYGIVKQSKGYISVRSEPGLGSTFQVYLPCSSGGEAALLSNTVPVPALREFGTVLLVDDQPGVRQLTRRILSDSGYRVLEAVDGEEGERIFCQQPEAIDLVLTDVQMPRCGGREMIRRLRVIKPSLAVVLMSGFGEQSEMDTSAIGTDFSFLQKPFVAETLRRTVRESLAANVPAPSVAASLLSITALPGSS